jgi:hypothetical protein
VAFFVPCQLYLVIFKEKVFMKSMTIQKLLLILFTTLGHTSFSQNNDLIEKQLIELNFKNFEHRSKVKATIQEFGFESKEMDSLNITILIFDSTALTIVTSILDQHGWLGKSEIGETANQTLFFIIQHAPNNSTRKKYFPMLKASAEMGESSLSEMATMKDRMLIQDGKLQVYGTQSRMVNGVMELYPFENPEKVNQRRRKVGLGKLK